MASGAVLTIKRDEAEDIFTELNGSDESSDWTRGTGLSIYQAQRLINFFNNEPAALSCDFTCESLVESLPDPEVGERIFRDLVTAKGNVIARCVKQQRGK